ncbi:hypothetical protein AAHE18_18G237900 [Arachis hypogaea]
MMASSSKDRENFVYLTKVVEQAERYDALSKTPHFLFFKFSSHPYALITLILHFLHAHIKWWILFSVGYKNVVGSRRASWRILSKIEQKEESRGNEVNAKLIREYMHKVEFELSKICSDIMIVLDEHLIPSTNVAESTVFYYKMKGYYYRYLAEFKDGDEKKEVADQSLKAYELKAKLHSPEFIRKIVMFFIFLLLKFDLLN